MKKKLLIALSSIVVLLLGAAVGGHAWLKAKLQKEQIVAEMETAWNCRAQLDSTAVSFFRSPAKVELIGLKLSPRDGEFIKPFGQRAKLEDAQALVSVKSAVLDVDLSSLMSGRLDVKDLKLKGVKVRTEIDDEGESSLQLMLDSPDTEYVEVVEPPTEAKPKAKESCDENSASADAPADKPHKDPKPKKKKRVRVKKVHKPFKAGDLVVALKVDEATVEDADIEILNRSEDTRLNFSRVNFSLKAIDVQASDLANHNSCDLTYMGHVLVEKPVAELKSAAFDVSGNGNFAPFDRNSGEWAPDLTINATVKKGGLLGGTKIADQMKDKDMKRLIELGIDLGDLAAGGVLQEDASTDVHAFRGKMLVKQETRLVFPEYDITLANGSSISAADDQISAKAVLVARPDLSTRILAQAKKSSVEKFGEDLANIGEALVRNALVDAKGQLVLPFKLKGKLSKPEVSLDTVVNSIKDSMKDAGKTLLEGLLKGGGNK
jgi:hypothetical protein